MIKNRNVKNKMKMKDLSLYVHIPFCVRKCAYCDFLSVTADEETKEAYIQALLLELESYRETSFSERPVQTVYIGGGTPSILSAPQTEQIVNKIRDVFYLTPECEMTMEMNPGTVTKEKSKCYFKSGIHRVSIGLQSPDDILLKRLGRIHTYEDFLRTYENVRNAGITNVNVDLMSALPGQSVEQYCHGLRQIMELEPEHISAYSLIIEEGTPFFEKYNNACDLLPEEQLPDEVQDRQMYEKTKDILLQAGYERYEISNYAKAGFSCKHNLVYWQRGDYLGLGLGSSSMIENVRFKNECNLKKYIMAWKNGEGDKTLGLDKEVLDSQAQMEEFMFLGLRMMRGVSEDEFRNIFGVSMQSIYGKQIEKMLKQDLLHRREEGEEVFFALTEKGIDVSNYVLAEFLL